MNGLELGERMASGAVKRPPVADLIGFDIERVAPGEAVVRFDAEPRHANPMGTLHGGILCDIADAAMGVAYASGLSEGEASRRWSSRLTSCGRCGARVSPRGAS